jgi:hypothetical protein
VRLKRARGADRLVKDAWARDRIRLIAASLLRHGSLTGAKISELNHGDETTRKKHVSFPTVLNVWNEMDALPLAEAHCKQFGKSARFARTEPYRAIFDCVAK